MGNRRVAIATICLLLLLPLVASLFLLTTPAASARLAADGTCELRVRDNGVERWQPADASFCALPTAIATATAAATATMTPMVGICGEDEMHWHPPVVDGCATGHEHGDAPPDWIAAAGYDVSYHFHGNTTAAENTIKHPAMKGFAARFNNQDIYLRYHAASNPLDRSARYHSLELFIRDATGAVSHMAYWYNTGDPTIDRVPRRQGSEPQQRPILLVVDRTSWDQGIRCEQWYDAPGQPLWGADFGLTICNTTTLYNAGENATAADQSTWVPAPDDSLGLTRRLELAWYANRSTLRGTFTTDQFGGSVNRCVEGASISKFGVSYPAVCLTQTIQPTLATIQFPGNAIQRTFPGQGVQLPN